MKIVFCINGLINSGGMEKVLLQRVNYMIEKYGYDITIITTDHNNNIYINKTPFFYVNSKIKIIDLNVNYLNYIEKNFIIKKIINIKLKRLHLLRLNKEIKIIKPDIVVSLGDDDRDIIYKIDYQCKKILEHHFCKKFYTCELENKNFFNKIKVLCKNYKEKKYIDRYDKFIVLTEEDKKLWGNNKIKVISNPLLYCSDKFSECKNKKIISVGRLSYEKGFDILIDVWSIIFKKYPDWILEVYGEGIERESLQNKINNLGLDKSLLLKGTVKDIQNKYLESSIYVMSSRQEGFGMVLIEAMSCGLPVVSFDCPCGPKDIIQNNEDGFLIKFGDIKQMAGKIEELIKNEEKRKLFGKNARKNVQKFSEDKIMNQWKELFEDLTKK